MAKKYASLETLRAFLDNLKDAFSGVEHKHKLSDITDYAIDSSLSSTSDNPVANKVINEEFEAISEAMGALESAIDDKADVTHNHDDIYYTQEQINSMELITDTEIDEICGTTIEMASEVTF